MVQWDPEWSDKLFLIVLQDVSRIVFGQQGQTPKVVRPFWREVKGRRSVERIFEQVSHGYNKTSNA